MKISNNKVRITLQLSSSQTRHPEHQQRPSFHTIHMKLVNESPEKLLHWSPSDDSLSSAVGVCGAELSESEKLYPDLQRKYINLDRVNYF